MWGLVENTWNQCNRNSVMYKPITQPLQEGGQTPLCCTVNIVALPTTISWSRHELPGDRAFGWCEPWPVEGVAARRTGCHIQAFQSRQRRRVVREQGAIWRIVGLLMSERSWCRSSPLGGVCGARGYFFRPPRARFRRDTWPRRQSSTFVAGNPT